MVPSHESGWFKLTINPIFCPEPVLGHARDSVLFAAVDVSTGSWLIEKIPVSFIRYKVWIVSVNSGRIICDTYEGTSYMLTPPFFWGLYKPVLVGVLTSYTYPVDVLSRPISFFFCSSTKHLKNEKLDGATKHNSFFY